MIVRKIEGSPGNTVRIAVGNSAAGFAAGVLYKDGIEGEREVRNIAQELLITVDSGSFKFRYAFNGISPTNTGNKIGHELGVGKSLMLRGWDQIQSFKHINDVSGSVSAIQVTPFYSGG